MTPSQLEQRRQRALHRAIQAAEAERARLALVQRVFELGHAGHMGRVWFDGPLIYVTADQAAGWWSRRRITWKRLREQVEAAEKRLLAASQFEARRPVQRETGAGLRQDTRRSG